MAATWTIFPRHHGTCETAGVAIARASVIVDTASPPLRRSPAGRLAVDDADDPSVLDAADRSLALGERRESLPHRRPHVELRAVGRVVRLRVAHDPAQRQDVAARDVAREVLDVLVRGRADELLGRAELDDRAVAHDRDAVAEAECLGEVVRDEHRRLADLALEAHDLVLHVAPDEGIERAERLVVEHDVRVRRERPCDADALLHAARQLVGELVRGVLQADELQHLVGTRAGARACHSLHLEPEGDVVDHAPVREQAEVLEDHRDGVAPQLAELGAIGGHHVVTDDLDLPAVGSIRRMSVRTSVDLPEPESPMTTNTSPGQTSSETSLTATTHPVFARSSARGRVGVRRADEPFAVRSEDLPDPLGADRRRARAVDAVLRCLESWLGGLRHARAADISLRAAQRPC